MDRIREEIPEKALCQARDEALRQGKTADIFSIVHEENDFLFVMNAAHNTPLIQAIPDGAHIPHEHQDERTFVRGEQLGVVQLQQYPFMAFKLHKELQ